MKYKHLSLEERHYIEVEKKSGRSANSIAASLDRSQPTISRELKRNRGNRGYRHQQADCMSKARHEVKSKAMKLTQEITGKITDYLMRDWSPEQIAGRLKDEGVVSLHHETIYQFILSDQQVGGSLYCHLRHQGKPYRKRYGSPRNRTGIPNRVDIDERPELVEQRKRVGDWEADTIIGKGHQGAIVTLDERKSKLRLAAPLSKKRSTLTQAAISTLLAPIQEYVKTITFDNGKEFTTHEMIASKLSCDTYFAKAYQSWQRGQNENANGLLRQYFPKAMPLHNVSQNSVFKAVHKLNSRPRKCLGFKTPYEAFKRLTGVDVENLLGYALIT